MNFPWLALCCVLHIITFYIFEVGLPNSYKRSIFWRCRSSSNVSWIWLRSKVNELSMTGTVLCCTHNFLYLRGRIAKFIQEVYPLKVQVKFECELNLIKVKSQWTFTPLCSSNDMNFIILYFLTLTFYFRTQYSLYLNQILYFTCLFFKSCCCYLFNEL